MDNRLVLGKVHIVEWLNDQDRKTGREIFDEIEPLGKASDPPVEAAYHPIATAGQLLGLLHALEEEYQRERGTPLLHLETHGAKEGIEARGETVSWGALAAALVPLNRLTGLNLVVLLAACEGFYGTAMLRPILGQVAVSRTDRAEPSDVGPRVAQGIRRVLAQPSSGDWTATGPSAP